MKYFNYFSINELFNTCSDEEVVKCVRSGFLDNLLTLLEVLDAIRESVGYPIIINSSFRDSKHNKKVGGSTFSQHLSGCAIDFRCPYIPFKTFYPLVRSFLQKSALNRYVGQVIFYHKRNFIHIALCCPAHPKLQFYNYEQGDN